MLSPGEASGDLHGAHAVPRPRARSPRACRLVGMGGERAWRRRAWSVHRGSRPRTAAVGGSEALGRVPALYRAYRALVRRLQAGAGPRVLVLIDFPEFNLRLARARAKRAGFRSSTSSRPSSGRGAGPRPADGAQA